MSIDDQASYPSIPNALVNVMTFRFRMYPVDIAIFISTKLLFFQISRRQKLMNFQNSAKI